jgi:hypothetical protein
MRKVQSSEALRETAVPGRSEMNRVSIWVPVAVAVIAELAASTLGKTQTERTGISCSGKYQRG